MNDLGGVNAVIDGEMIYGRCVVCGASLAESERGRGNLSAALRLRYCSKACQQKRNSGLYYARHKAHIQRARGVMRPRAK